MLPDPRFAFCAAAIAASACAAIKGDTASAGLPPMAAATLYDCSGAPVAIGVIDGKMTMRAGDEDFALRQAVTASGSKYEAESDPSTWFWSKGEEGLASIRGRQAADCVKAGGERGADKMEREALKARGNEPGWSLEIAGDRLTLLSDYGQTRVEAKAAMTRAGDATIWRAEEKGLTVVWEDRICADDATGMPHPARATVNHAGKKLEGCGGDPKSLLVGGEWIVEDINKGGIIDNSRASLKFDEAGRVAGMSSCNSYSAAYTLTGEALTIGRAAATLRACAPALMNQERKFFDVLGAVSSFEIDETGALILKSSDGGTILARR